MQRSPARCLPAIRAAGHEIIHIGRRDAGQGADPVWGVAVSDYEGMLADAAVDVVYNALQIISMSRGHCGRWQQESRFCVKSQLR